jgi:hypothetical protein
MLVEIKCQTRGCNFRVNFYWKLESNSPPDIEHLAELREPNPMSQHHDNTKITIKGWSGHVSGHSNFIVRNTITKEIIKAIATTDFAMLSGDVD